VAEITTAWTNKTGRRIVYWGGLAHTVNSVARRFPSDAATGQNAGNYLRERSSSAIYRFGLTFHHGSTAVSCGGTTDDYVEAVPRGRTETYLLQIHGTWPDRVREWLGHAIKDRLIGPGIHELSVASVSTWSISSSIPARHTGAFSVRAFFSAAGRLGAGYRLSVLDLLVTHPANIRALYRAQ